MSIKLALLCPGHDVKLPAGSLRTNNGRLDAERQRSTMNDNHERKPRTTTNDAQSTVMSFMETGQLVFLTVQQLFSSDNFGVMKSRLQIHHCVHGIIFMKLILAPWSSCFEQQAMSPMVKSECPVQRHNSIALISDYRLLCKIIH